MRRANPRSRRVAEQLQRELSGLIRLDVDDPKVGLVTITDVEVTGDLAHAKIFFTVLDEDDARKAETLAALQRAAGFLRAQLGHRLLLRSVPQLPTGMARPGRPSSGASRAGRIASSTFSWPSRVRSATCLGGRSESVGRITSGHCCMKLIQRNSSPSRSVRAAI